MPHKVEQHIIVVCASRVGYNNPSTGVPLCGLVGRLFWLFIYSFRNLSVQKYTHETMAQTEKECTTLHSTTHTPRQHKRGENMSEAVFKAFDG